MDIISNENEEGFGYRQGFVKHSMIVIGAASVIFDCDYLQYRG